MTIISTTVGKNPLEKMEYPSESSKDWNAELGCNLKNDRMISVSQANHSISQVIQVCSPNTNAKEAEAEWFCEYLQ